ncbi:T9SS type B sorting domain-containing protein [Kaistella palustris]|uniref:T9SS type B sorting domain-containing protein n=1 Tax=Kaistella palustris TaxID=493376 RepID=UPI000401FC74|nr:gliding motility-associated C-terminal domain-containing protein [Kaistella palustris]
MKKILLLIFFFTFLYSFAQLDREHWFAPMYDGQSNTGDEQFLHLSTNETTPFNVKVYSNNIIVAEKVISKGNPGVIVIKSNPGVNEIARNRIIINTAGELHQVINKGLYVKAEKPCFANLRFGVTNHTEIITSKGTAGIGTQFFTVVAPSSLINIVGNNNLGFAASFIATEDNTTVVVNNFKKPLAFTNYGMATNFTFKLNKGQSYIIDGRVSNTNGKDGFIGAEVNSDKPISMSNGNFNGQYASTDVSDGSDILMDQSVPVDKLGDEFVIVKGYGSIGNKMEGAIIVATEPMTSIYLNDSVTPTAILANKGDFYKVSETNYVNRGNQHYNLHIVTDKNVYVYQLLAGVASGSAPLATGGMNYIPPLNCYLPKRIDEISYINYLSNVPHNPPFTTKLNIITEKNATVKVNGVIPNTLYGPYDISVIAGNQNWVTYSIPNVTGNITVESTKAVTAGIASGNAAFGYGGYFAGFSSIPLITKTEGDCLPGVKLEVTEGFDSYEWLIKNAAGGYDPAPGVNNIFSYIPPEAGIYAVKVKQGSCAEIQTRDFKFYNCTTYTNNDYDICTTTTITPAFALSTQALNPSSVVIDMPPTKGAVTKNADGTITYTANLNATGTDTFKYSFCGTGSIPDCETVQATVHLNQIEHYDKILNECSATSMATFDLTSAQITPDIAVAKTYFSDALYSVQIPDSQLTNYISEPGTVYVKLHNTYGCDAEAKIELKITAPPVVNPALYTHKTCDEDIDGVIDNIYKVDLSNITPLVVQNPADFTVKYYETEAKAIAGLTDNLTGIYSFTGNTGVWIRVESPAVCAPVIMEILLQIGIKGSLITNEVTKNICDTGLDDTESIVLSDYIPLFTTAAGNSATFFNTLTDAQQNLNSTSANQVITGAQTFYYRFSIPGFCDNIGTLKVNLTKGTPSTFLLPSYTVCTGSTVTLNVGTGYSSILWSTGDNSETINAGPGNYFVDLTNASNCVYRQYVTVTELPKPQWTIGAFNAVICDDNLDGQVEVKFSSVTSQILQNPALFTVEYSLSRTFSPLLPDNWTYSADTKVYVRAVSADCPPDVRTIDFKIGDKFMLLTSVISYPVCDNDLNNTENINLANYNTLFTPDAGVTVKYFDDRIKAQNNLPGQNIGAAQTVSGDKTFYYRFKKAGFCDTIGTLNILLKASTPTALLDSYTVCAGSSITLMAESTYTDYVWKKGNTTVFTTQTAILPAGVYTVFFTNASGCTFTKSITILESPLPKWNIGAYNPTLCDDDFDGVIHVKLSTVTPVIIQNSALFTVEYSLFSDFSTILPDDWLFSKETNVYVRAVSAYCGAETKMLTFKFGNRVQLITDNASVSECDDDLDGIKTVNLSKFVSVLTNESGVQTTYFNSLSAAQQNIGSVPADVTVTNSGTYYLRFHKNGFCDNIAALHVTVKIPKISTQLGDQAVCPGSLATLDPGSGFASYHWSTGETTQSIKVPVGEYWVDLTFEGCTHRQSVTVTEILLPGITSVEIQGTTVIVNVTGGTPPYEYALDGNNYQTSNVFTNVAGGDHTVYVISADNCSPVTAEITVVEVYNAISPDGDGINDILDYSVLLKKEEASIKIFDRFGNTVFTGDKNNRFSWDGKSAGKAVTSGSYWYVMKWREPGSASMVEYNGWVLVKNRR